LTFSVRDDKGEELSWKGSVWLGKVGLSRLGLARYGAAWLSRKVTVRPVMVRLSRHGLVWWDTARCGCHGTLWQGKARYVPAVMERPGAAGQGMVWPSRLNHQFN
jgi:hypothetical protein